MDPSAHGPNQTRTSPKSSMQITPAGQGAWMTEFGKLVRKYLKEHKSEWETRTGISKLWARLCAENRAWKYASKNLQRDKNDAHKLY